MGRRLKDLTGKKFGVLTVLRRGKNIGPAPGWECLCSCGQERLVRGGSLKNNKHENCTCKLKDYESSNRSSTNEYNIWHGIKQRCTNPNNPRYKDYKDRGMSNEWKTSFLTFYKDMGPRPSKEHSVERRNNNKGYSKENCYWATPLEQQHNTKSNRIITIDGESKCLAEWERLSPVTRTGIRRRLERGWNPKDAVFKPNQKNGDSRI